MGVINWVAFGGVLVDLVVISAIVSSIYWGYRRGLVSVIFKVLAFIVSLLVVFLLYKPVSNTIIEKTNWDDNLANSIRQTFEGTTLSDGKLIDVEEGSSISQGVIDLINSFVTEALQKAEIDPVGYVSIQLSKFMITGGVMIGLLIISRVLLTFVRFLAEILANLPFIKMFNKTGGLVYGIIKGFLVVYAIFAVLSMISPLISSWGIINAIQDSAIGSKMYNNNFLINLITNLLVKPQV